MSRSSINLCCSEHGQDVMAATPWQWCSPTQAGHPADNHRATAHLRTMENLEDRAECREQVILLLQRERSGPRVHYYLSGDHTLNVDQREMLVTAINSAAFIHGFQFETVALAVSLLDRFAATERLLVDQRAAIPLAAVACLSLAAKLEEVHVPSNLHDLQASMPSLGVHEAIDIHMMEVYVMRALGWRCTAVTSATFLDQLLYDAWLGPLSFLHPAEDHYFAYVREYALNILSHMLKAPLHLQYGASSKAAAAMVLAFQAVGLRQHLLHSLICEWTVLGIEQVLGCVHETGIYIANEQAPEYADSLPAMTYYSPMSSSPSSPIDCPASSTAQSAYWLDAAFDEEFDPACKDLETASSFNSACTIFEQ